MKLFRFGERDRERPGVLLDGRRLDVSAAGLDYDEAFFGGDGMARLRQWLERYGDSAPVVADGVRIGPPICRPSKIVCIGLNFSDHAAEAGMATPEEPIVFLKATSALAGPYDDLVIPPGAEKVDWEVELAFVIGRRASHVPMDEALGHVAGYVLHNDISERAYQLERGGQWTKGKGCDGFAPLGPVLVTPDELGDIGALGMWLKVDGRDKQRGSTAKMIFDVPFLVSYLSRFMTLLPGDVVSTGTPPGVGLGFKPPQFLHPGSIIEWGIEGLGEARQRVVAYSKGISRAICLDPTSSRI